MEFHAIGKQKKQKDATSASFCLGMGEGLLGGRSFLGLFAFVPVVLLLEFFDTARGVHELHLAGEERMAHGADFDRNILLGRPRGELVATTAGNGSVFVFGVNVFFHGSLDIGFTLISL
jgi:hypothetical protein